MKNKKVKNNKIKYLPVLLILLSITIIAGTTFAYFTDRKEDTSDLTFSKVELSSETTIGINGELRDVIPGTKLVDGAVEFSKSIDSEAIYVRAKISFSLPSAYANDTDMQAIVKQLRNATDFNIITTEQHGAVWSAKDGNYFYLMEKPAEGEPTNLMRVDTIDTFVLSNEVVVPRDLESLPNNAQYMKSINFHIAFEAIQADNVSNNLEETKVTFDTLFPTPAVEKAGIYVSIMNNDLMSVKEEITLTEAGTIEEPEAEDIVVDGTTTHIFDGWYANAGLTEKFDFTKKVTASVSLYPKYIEVSEGLVFIEVYETATTSEGPTAVGDIIGYSVAQGTCADTEIILPLEYNGKPILAIADNGFKDNENLINISLNDTITSIGNYAFYGCINLELTSLPNSVVSLGGFAFYNCTKLKLTTLPDGITAINSYAFYRCENLALTSLSNNIVRIGQAAFANCSKMVLTSLPSGLTSISDSAFGGCNMLALTSLPSDTTTIGQFAFANCSNLQLTTLPSGVTNIYYQAFAGCSSIKMLHLPSGLNSIGENAFYGCTNLNYLLCANKAVAALAVGKGVSEENIYSAETTGYDGVTFTDSAISGIATGSDGNKAWVRNGVDGAYTYYKEYVSGYTITYMNPDLTSVYTTVEVEDGAFTVEQEAPTNDNANAIFDGWYTDSELTNRFTFGSTLSEDITLYPKYIIGYMLTVMDIDKVSVYTQKAIKMGDSVEKIEFENPVDGNGTTTQVVEGWYSDSGCTTKFEFGGELTENTTIYPNALTVSTGLEYEKVRVGGVSGYSFTKGSCTATTVVVPDKYLGLPVVSVADSAFYQDSYLTKIVLPETIISIGHSAFFWCYKLASANIPSGVTEIGGYGFAYCGALEINSLPSGLTSIEDNAFNQCTNLRVTSLPSGIKFIGDTSFGFCTNMALTSLPSGLLSISTNAFYGCSSLALTSIPSSVTDIGSRAFYQCGSLPKNEYVYYLEIDDTNTYNVVSVVSKEITTVVWPENTTAITGGAFVDCASLELDSLPSGLTWIGTNAFYGCTSLTLNSLPSGVVKLDYGAFYNCTSLALTSLPNGITILGEYAFAHCSALALTSLPSGLQHIEKSALYGCTSLKLTALPSGLKSVGEIAFYSSNLVTIFIPYTVTSVGSNAFSSCSELKYILCETNSLANKVKGNCNSTSYIYVSQGSGYSGVTETEVVVNDGVTIYTATDNDGYKWVRTSDNKYYKCIVTG